MEEELVHVRISKVGRESTVEGACSLSKVREGRLCIGVHWGTAAIFWRWLEEKGRKTVRRLIGASCVLMWRGVKKRFKPGRVQSLPLRMQVWFREIMYTPAINLMILSLLASQCSFGAIVGVETMYSPGVNSLVIVSLLSITLT